MPDAHVHRRDRHHALMRIWWCECGQEFDERRGKWRAPKLNDGVLRKFAWEKKQRLAAAGDTSKC